MTKFKYVNKRGYSVTIEAETKEKADDIFEGLNKIFKEKKK